MHVAFVSTTSSGITTEESANSSLKKYLPGVMNRVSKKKEGPCVEQMHTEFTNFFTVGGLIELRVI